MSDQRSGTALSLLRQMRLALASLLLPSGFAIWTWGLDEGDGDVCIRAKDLD